MKSSTASHSKLEQYFQKYRDNIVGVNHPFKSPYGEQKIRYFDWTASGRLYSPIEEKMQIIFGPFVANTHTETTETGTAMTLAYHVAMETIKKHVHADDNDILIMTGTGMTGAISKLQRILGLKFSDQLKRHAALMKNYPMQVFLAEEEIPVVFITHMEHHSNQTSWVESDAEVVVVPSNKDGEVDIEKLEELLQQYKHRKIKIGSFTACSNVTGILTPYHQLAKTMHKYDGLCFVDFAACAPYIDIDMHPKDSAEKLDAIFFSPHKFLGGPGTSGVLIFNKKLYPSDMPPDHPGGGTVAWTNPWGEQRYHANPEAREDGGTPGFLQTIRTALAIQLKEQMGVKNILEREEELLPILLKGLREIDGIHVLDDKGKKRLGIVSFYSETIHYNLIVKLLNDRFGMQTRGGCSCAGTYGHCLFDIGREQSKVITDRIDKGDQSTKPGWVRVSLHPTLQTAEVVDFIQAMEEISSHIKDWEKDYTYDTSSNEFIHINESQKEKKKRIKEWFEL